MSRREADRAESARNPSLHQTAIILTETTDATILKLWSQFELAHSQMSKEKASR